MNYNAPDKNTNDQWSATEHNEIKAAVNSKFDADNVAQDLTNPSNDKVPSTAAMATAIGADGQFKFRGEVDVTETLNTIKEPGYYSIAVNLTPTDATFPGGFVTNANGGELIVYYDGTGKLTQQISAQGNADDDTLTYRRTSMNNGSVWSQWDFMVYSRWLELNYGAPNILPDGNPTITCAGCTITKVNCTDLMGRIVVHNDSVVSTIGSNILITFDNSRPSLRTAQLTKYLSGADSVQIEVYGLDSSQLVVRILEDLPIGNEFSFFYFLK